MGSEQAGLPGMSSAAEYEADLREREDDPTPRGIPRAVLPAVIGPGRTLSIGVEVRRGVIRPKLMRGLVDALAPATDVIRVLDVCAGWGCWASEIRRLAALQGWPIHVTGVELDSRKREHLRRWCDDPVTGADVRQWLRAQRRRASFEIALGNPAFSLLVPKARPGETIKAAADRSILGPLLDVAPAVLQLHHQSAFVRGRVGRELRRRHPPAASWVIPGPASFRADGKTDQRCYQVTLWLRDHDGPCSEYMLDELDREALRWRTLPGTETGAEAEALGLVEVSR